jgi:hypothetical protein
MARFARVWITDKPSSHHAVDRRISSQWFRWPGPNHIASGLSRTTTACARSLQLLVVMRADPPRAPPSIRPITGSLHSIRNVTTLLTVFITNCQVSEGDDWTRDDPNHREPGSQRKRPRRAGSDDQRLDPEAGSSYGEGAPSTEINPTGGPNHPWIPARHFATGLPCSRPFRLR